MLPQLNTNIFTDDIFIEINEDGLFSLSDRLTEILLTSRETYDWPSGTGCRKSQENILSLENEFATLLTDLTPIKAKQIISKVSSWGGNNAISQNNIDRAFPDQQEEMCKCLKGLKEGIRLNEYLYRLSNIPGIGLVMATKVYRFCSPMSGAALDRHSSYFFNSLPIHFQSRKSEYTTSLNKVSLSSFFFDFHSFSN